MAEALIVAGRQNVDNEMVRFIEGLGLKSSRSRTALAIIMVA